MPLRGANSGIKSVGKSVEEFAMGIYKIIPRCRCRDQENQLGGMRTCALALKQEISGMFNRVFISRYCAKNVSVDLSSTMRYTRNRCYVEE